MQGRDWRIDRRAWYYNIYTVRMELRTWFQTVPSMRMWCGYVCVHDGERLTLGAQLSAPSRLVGWVSQY